MGFLAKAFFRGLAAVLPVALTVYILWWFLSGAEQLVRKILPDIDPTPGLGIAAGVAGFRRSGSSDLRRTRGSEAGPCP